MKRVFVLFVFALLAAGAFAQEKSKLKVNEKVIKPNKELNKRVAPPAPKVNKATESNRKRPGGTVPNNSNSKQAPPASGGGKKEPVKRD